MKTDKMRHGRYRAALMWTAVLVGFASCIGTGIAKGSGPMVLIKPQEAAMANAPAEAERPVSILEAEEKKGPDIIVKSPKSGETYVLPLKVEMKFVPKFETKIDLASLEVIYVKVFNIDITERVKPFATEEGILIPEAKIPRGRHRITIRIADTSGNVSSENLKFVVQ